MTLTWIAFTCPNCQAKPGERCTQPDEKGRHEVKTPHSARVDKAENW